MKWCARCDCSRWICEIAPFSGSRACTCGGAGIPCPVCNPADYIPSLHRGTFRSPRKGRIGINTDRAAKVDEA